jgi:hypothetical protein
LSSFEPLGERLYPGARPVRVSVSGPILTDRQMCRGDNQMPNKRHARKSGQRRSVLITAAVFAGSLALLVVLAGAWEHPTAVQMEVVDTLDFTVKVTVGAIVGLLGGKMTI